MNEHTQVYALHSGWTPVGALPADRAHIVLGKWGWFERTFAPVGMGAAWYVEGTSAAHPLKKAPVFRPWDPREPWDRKLGCLWRLGRYSLRQDRWILPTQDLVVLAVRLATDCGLAVYYKARLGFECEILPHFSRPDNVTYDFDVGANLFKFGGRNSGTPISVQGPDAIQFTADGSVITKYRFLVSPAGR